MKKKLPAICNIASIVLVIAFVIKCVIDYQRYLKSFGSAPFRVWVYVNAIYLLLPAAIVFLVGLFIKKKQ